MALLNATNSQFKDIKWLTAIRNVANSNYARRQVILNYDEYGCHAAYDMFFP